MNQNDDKYLGEFFRDEYRNAKISDQFEDRVMDKVAASSKKIRPLASAPFKIFALAIAVLLPAGFLILKGRVEYGNSSGYLEGILSAFTTPVLPIVSVVLCFIALDAVLRIRHRSAIKR